MSKVNVDGIMIFEQPFARVPYEGYRKLFRITQKSVEKELAAIQASSKDLVRSSQDGGHSREEALRALEAMIVRAESLKRKLAMLEERSEQPTQEIMRERIEHLAVVEAAQANDGADFERWADTRLDRWLVDWALRTGKEKTARQIAKDKSIERLVDIELFAEIHHIERALEAYSCTEALAWCSENKVSLRKIKCTLEFDLRLQEYIELCRARKQDEAIAYSRKYLASWRDTHINKIRQASALLAFSSSTSCAAYKRLYDLSRWSTLVRSFRIAIFTLNTLPTEPLLHLALYAGLASLKLPGCYAHDDTRNPDCPVCDASLGTLATEVPFSHHVNSTIVCAMTGKIVDENNPPMVFLESGYAYSRNAMEEMAAKKDGEVYDIRGKISCKFSALRKVFIS